jgi:hypothetical protein
MVHGVRQGAGPVTLDAETRAALGYGDPWPAWLAHARGVTRATCAELRARAAARLAAWRARHTDHVRAQAAEHSRAYRARQRTLARKA